MVKAGSLHTIKLISLITAISAVMSFSSACRRNDVVIPDIPSPDNTEATEPSATETADDPSNGYHLESLNVALPYQDSTVRYLASMYYAKKNGLWDTSFTGTNVDLDSLGAINPDFIITTSRTADEGISSSVLKAYKDNDQMPDLFLASDIDDAIKSDLIIPINEFAGSDTSYDNDRIFANCAMQLSRDGVTYGIPHTMSVQLIVGNSDYIPSEGRPPIIYSCEDLTSYLEAINKEYDGIVPLMRASDLFPYLGSAFNHGVATSYMLNKEYVSTPTSAKLIFQNEKNYIDSLYTDGLSSDKDANGASPVYSRQCALWASSSASLKTWELYYPSKIYTILLPSYDADNQSPANVHIYPLCVSKYTNSGKLASDFGSFISFDTDAQLLILRCESRSGFFPVTRSSAVWDLINEDPTFGQTSYILRQILDKAVFVPSDNCDPVFSRTKEYFNDYKAKEEYSLEELYGT